ncbi:MAG: hypothetical protein N2652_00330 [Kiritimatiellae bacterium]|nr:hypothetical protein [Kiritimatiellia bacterium]
MRIDSNVWVYGSRAALLAAALGGTASTVAAPLEAPSVPPSNYGTTGAPLATEWPLGQIVTNVPCVGDESQTFHLYLPRGLQAGRKYPLLLFVSSSVPGGSTLGRFLDAVELNGWMLVVPAAGASENFDRALAAARLTLSNALVRLPVDSRRVYAGGFSHGVRAAVLALHETKGIEPAGLLLINMGVGPEEIARLPKTAALATIGSAATISRWDLACTALKFSDGRPSRMEWHTEKPGRWGPTEAIIDSVLWMNGIFLRRERGGRLEAAREREAWVAAVLDRVEPAVTAAPERAAEWLAFLQGFPASGPLQARIRILQQQLKNQPAAEAWRKVWPDMERLIAKHFATSPKGFRSGNGTAAAKKDFGALLQKAAGTRLEPLIQAFAARGASGG